MAYRDVQTFLALLPIMQARHAGLPIDET